MNLFDVLDIKMSNLIRTHSEDEIKQRIKELDYQTEFLHSAYWTWVRHHKLINFGNKCELCGSKNKMQIHHRRYDNHGLEHKWEVMYKDLMITCEVCHSKIHGFILTEADF